MTKNVKKLYPMLGLRQLLLSNKELNLLNILVNNSNNIKEQDIEDDNVFSCAVMALLGYQTCYENPVNEYRALIAESVVSLKAKNKNEQINRVLAHLHANGMTAYTDMERAILNLEKDIFVYAKEEWDNRLEIYLDNYQHDVYKKKQGNGTIFRIGIPVDISLTQAMCVSCYDDKLWPSYLELYFEHLRRDGAIDFEMIVCLNYFYSVINIKPNVIASNIYFIVLKYFNNLEIRGNLNKYDEYWKFVTNYVLHISALGYAETKEAVDLGLRQGNTKDTDNLYRNPDFIEEKIFTPIIQRMHDCYDKIEVDLITTGVEDIEKFLYKNLEIMKAVNTVAIRQPRINTDIRTAYVNEQEVKRLFAQKDATDYDLWLQMLNNALTDGKITPYEYSELLEKK